MKFPTRLTGLALAAAAALAAGAPAHAELIYGLTTTNALVTFDSATPTNGTAPITITGLQSANERVLALDLRPTTGLLYGLTTDDKVYSISTSGVASFVSMLSSPIASDVVGFDFNPMADQAGMTSLRIVSSTGQNFAYNVGTGATTVATAVQTGFAAVAYSNNDTNPATATSLYYIDMAADQLKVATANFNAPTITTVGALGFNANGVAGFDISFSGVAYAVMTDADTGKSGLYTLNLGTGAATFAGSYGIGGNTAIAPPLVGITAAIPEPGTYGLMLAGLAALGFVARRRRRA